MAHVPIVPVNITDVQADETNVNWYADGERGSAAVLNRPIKEVAAVVNETVAEVNRLSDTSIIAGDGLTGGGDLSEDRTVSIGTPGTLSGNTTNAVTAESHTHEISDATETVAGVVEKATNAEALAGTANKFPDAAGVRAVIAQDAPTKTGTGASGTWDISVTGNAATATKLATAGYVVEYNATTKSLDFKFVG